MLEATGLTKRYGGALAVDDVTFTARAGQVTALLGPAGSGRSTVLRLALGMTRGQGVALFDGKPFNRLRRPAREVGVLLTPAACHPHRTLRTHLRMVATASGIPAARVEEVLDLVGLTAASRNRFQRLSPAMARRLGIGVALLGDPHTLLLDEPTTGLDDQARAWLRELLRAFAAEGRAVLITSSTLAEATSMADHLVVLQEGKLVTNEPTSALAHEGGRSVVLARTPQADRLCAALDAAGVSLTRQDPDPTAVAISGLSRQEVGEIAFANQVILHELSERPSRLGMPFLGIASAVTDTAHPVATRISKPLAGAPAGGPAGSAGVSATEPFGASS